MSRILHVLSIVLAFAASSTASETVLLENQESDSALLLLDRSVQGRRNEILLESAQRPPRIVAEYPDDPADDWTEVRWVFRFPLRKTLSSVREARLYLWAQSEGLVDVQPKIELINGSQTEKIEASDRNAEAIGEAVLFEYPTSPSVIELDVTALVNDAIKRDLGYAVFRISALSDLALGDGQEKRQMSFGGPVNVWKWPENHPPSLQLIID